ncbi:4Fe-4S binding protein [Geobacter sp. SVR]|uniref:4Fe-4S binding protein n=1 Tax=Geobacter sp. SVR TaxID=2495594 RepID=UPI00143EF60B|nr:4Fe-4S binding protein [Geobacter sp. SVR]BCS55354.1 (Fe-S)-binding protein [Geobacter sp. SVR]GCF87279.1 (Fe-S)-binding protein [Geobacter sp. SVR]
MPTRYVQPLRILIQCAFLAFMLWLGMRFYQFVQHFRSNGATAFVPRPDGIEGFLPISGLLGLSAWLKGAGINPVHPAALVVLLTVLAVSLLLRRSFCSWICPVGTISESAWKLGFKVFRRNLQLPKRLDVALRGLKYLLLALFIYPIVIRMDTGSLRDFILSDYHRVADVRLLDFFLHPSSLAAGVILFLLLLSLPFKNPFCRYLCPYGALLGLVAMLSPVRVSRDRETCVSCGVCSQVCPTRIDVMRKRSVNSPECIGCWRCIAHCRAEGTLSMRLAGRVAISGIVFALLVVLCFWGGTAIGEACDVWHTAIPLSEYRVLLGR